MKIKLSIVKSGSSVGEVVLGGCDNISNIVPDIVLTCLNIRCGYGFDADQVAKEWCGISKTFSNFLQMAANNEPITHFYDLYCRDGWVSFSLVD